MGMLRWIEARAFRCKGCPVHSERAHAAGRGDGGPDVGVCHVDVRQGALSRNANATPVVCPTGHWLPAPTTHMRPPVARQGPEEGTMRERQDYRLQLASPRCGGRAEDEQ